MKIRNITINRIVGGTQENKLSLDKQKDYLSGFIFIIVYLFYDYSNFFRVDIFGYQGQIYLKVKSKLDLLV